MTGNAPVGGERRAFAPAKVNLTLRVLGRRPNGYHALESLVAFAHVGDTLTSVPSCGAALGKVEGPTAIDLVGENLIARAARVLRDVLPDIALPSVSLEKRLPVAGGVGGGSADAAAYLRLARDLNSDQAHRIDWIEAAARIGADVPVCLESRPALMTGTGERLQPLPCFKDLPAVLVSPRCAVPDSKTRDVFRRLRAPAINDEDSSLQPTVPTTAEALFRCIAEGRNELENAATSLMPPIREVRAALEATDGVRVVRLSGAGPTMFALFNDESAAAAAAQDVSSSQPGWWVVATRLGSPPLT